MERGDNPIKRELYFFWGIHPNAKFSRPIIDFALDCNMRDLDSALEAMVTAGLLDTNIQNGVTIYSLTKNEERRRPILEFAKHSHY
jgi:hypothetical protein